MRTRSILSVMLITAVAITCGITEAMAGFPAPPGLPAPHGLPGSPDVNVHINGYLPAPPGVFIHFDAGRPYYVERGRRVYMKEKGHARHHGDYGHKYGHYKHKRHGH
jgi:hypothetical protein